MKFFTCVALAVIASVLEVQSTPIAHLDGRNTNQVRSHKKGHSGKKHKSSHHGTGNSQSNDLFTNSNNTQSNSNGQSSSSSSGSNDDLQTSLTLDTALIGSNLALNGLSGTGAEAGEVASLTSTNNFINFCASVNQPITNGLQVVGGSCNPVPMGSIIPKANMPSAAFVNPPNFSTIDANTNFTIQMAINNMETGNFANAKTNYYAAPQQLNGDGLVIGHSHVTVQVMTSLDSTEILDPTIFAFFKGFNDVAVDGILSAVVSGGLPAGAYRMCSINTSANHTPVLVAVAQHGGLDTCSYFTVSDGGSNSDSGNNNNDNNGGNKGDNNSGNNDDNNKTASSSTTTTSAASQNTSSSNKGGSNNNNNKGNNNKGSSSQNLQLFNNSLGGISAPAVSQQQEKFIVETVDAFFESLENALQRSCDIQNNKCSDFANSKHNIGISVSACGQQHNSCLSQSR